MLICLLISISCYSTFANEIAIENATKEFKEKISTHKGFEVWAKAKLSKKIKLYNSEEKLSAYLFNVIREDKIIGYMLVNPKNKQIMEYALGQSPYADYLSNYIELKKEKFKNKKLTLLYDGPSLYGVLVEEKNTVGKGKEIIDFTNDGSIKIDVDTMKDIRPLLEEIDLQVKSITIQSTFIEEKLSNVPYYNVYHGCGPTAGYHIVYYWDKTGYPNLIISSQSATNVIDELYDKMGTFPVGGGNYATLPSSYAKGLEKYMNQSKICNTII
jgi:hypothetical protein